MARLFTINLATGRAIPIGSAQGAGAGEFTSSGYIPAPEAGK